MDTNQFQDIVARSREVLLVLPPNPSFDIVASGLALYKSLATFGKKSYIFCPTSMLVEFNRLVGVNEVGDKLGEKNLAIQLRDYPAANIERVSYDIENGEMKLTIIPKDGVPSPVKEQVAISLSGIAADVAILVGVENVEELGGVNSELAKIPQTIFILGDKRREGFGTGRGGLEIADPGSSSVSETVGMLILSANLPLDGDLANNLFMGLTNATNNFTASRVRPETFELASRLLRSRGPGQSGQQPSAQQATTPVNPVTQEKNQNEEEAPQDWFKPKVYKGTNMP